MFTVFCHKLKLRLYDNKDSLYKTNRNQNKCLRVHESMLKMFLIVLDSKDDL